VAVGAQGGGGGEVAGQGAQVQQQGHRETVPRERGLQGAGGKNSGGIRSGRGQACNGRGGGAGGEPAGARGGPHHCRHFAARLACGCETEKGKRALQVPEEEAGPGGQGALRAEEA